MQRSTKPYPRYQGPVLLGKGRICYDGSRMIPMYQGRLRSATVFLNRGTEPRELVYGAEARISQRSCDRRLANYIARQQHCTGLHDTGTGRGTMGSKTDTTAPHSPLLGTATCG
jgi:hypothetical protein